MWECQFRDFCKKNPRIYSIINAGRPHFAQGHKGKVTETQILDSVVGETIFGMFECDIEVPKQWGDGFSASLSPREYFTEMCPLFCNTVVSFDDIGEHMQDHVRAYGLSEKPRRLLISGTKARQVLLATPLLRWYLNHGMKVTKIHQVVEFRSQACFKRFENGVSTRDAPVMPHRNFLL